MHPLKNKYCVVMGANHIYAGTLDELTPDRVVLLQPSIIYETGAWDRHEWQNAERLPTPRIYLERTAVESFFELVREEAAR